MSPSEATGSQSTATSLHPLPTAGNAKKSFRSNFSKTRRLSDNFYINSPLTPWEDEPELKQHRKLSLKFSNRQGKNVKNNTKDPKRKDKKIFGKTVGFPVNFANCTEGDAKQLATNFEYHSDIGQYMREYRELRNATAAGHRDCSCHGAYGPEEIDKVYDSLGISKQIQKNRILTSNKKTTLPRVKDAPATHQTDNSEYDESDSESTSDSSVSSTRDNELASPDARKRRNNLNLSPLRKQVRLPDSNNFPVQTVSGLGMQELARLAATRNEMRITKEKPDAISPKLRYSSLSDKKFLSTALHLQEKTLCRVIDLSLPEVYGAENSSEDKKEKQTTRSSFDHHKALHHISKTETESSTRNPLDPATASRLQKLDLGDPQDDTLAIAIGTSRSCQSSVLSNAISPLSNTSCSFSPHRTQTVKEMLSAAVRDLHPFSKNGTKIQKSQKKVDNSNENRSFQDSENVRNNSKQLVSLHTYRNLSYRPSMRKFMEELYSSEKEDTVEENDESCLVTGKQLQQLKSFSNNYFPTFVSKEYSKLTVKLGRKSQNSPQTEGNKIPHRARGHREARECYEPIRRVVTLETQRATKPAKLAILTKCHTVVKPQVSVRGVTL